MKKIGNDAFVIYPPEVFRMSQRQKKREYACETGIYSNPTYMKMPKSAMGPEIYKSCGGMDQ
jgi:hypothetical protein